jgi:hypothetical protein
MADPGDSRNPCFAGAEIMTSQILEIAGAEIRVDQLTERFRSGT